MAVVREGVSVGAVGTFQFGVHVAVQAQFWAIGALGEVGQATHRHEDVKLDRCGPVDFGSFGAASLLRLAGCISLCPLKMVGFRFL